MAAGCFRAQGPPLQVGGFRRSKPRLAAQFRCCLERGQKPITAGASRLFRSEGQVRFVIRRVSYAHFTYKYTYFDPYTVYMHARHMHPWLQGGCGVCDLGQHLLDHCSLICELGCVCHRLVPRLFQGPPACQGPPNLQHDGQPLENAFVLWSTSFLHQLTSSLSLPGLPSSTRTRLHPTMQLLSPAPSLPPPHPQHGSLRGVHYRRETLVLGQS